MKFLPAITMKKPPTAVLLTTLMFTLTACSQYDDEHDHPDLKTGKDFYNYHCAECHKASGMGQIIHGIPPLLYSNLNRTEMRKMITSDRLHSKSNMPVFKKMPAREARSIVSHIVRLGKERFDPSK